MMNSSSSDIVYICVQRKNENQFWVLSHKNGLKVAQLSTKLLELFVGTPWEVFVVTDLSLIDGDIIVLFENVSEFMFQVRFLTS